VAQPDGPEIIRQLGQTGRERHRAEEQGQYDASAPVIDEVPGEKTAQGVRPHENGHEADIHGVAQLLTRDPRPHVSGDPCHFPITSSSASAAANFIYSESRRS